MVKNAVALLLLLASSGLTTTALAASPYEDDVIESIKSLHDQNIRSSLNSLSKLVEKYPNSKLGHLVLADILSARAGAKNLSKRFDSENNQLDGLRDEIKYRWDHRLTETPAIAGLIPANLVQSSPSQRYIVVVDASKARLYVYENMGTSHKLVDSYYMTVGKAGMGKLKEGDLRTPVGVYHVTSYLPGEELPARYGPGAYPINYPNEFDKLKKRTGYGIWIHGTEPDNYNRIPLASDGCVSLSNDEFLDIEKYIETDGSTPVIIADNFNWLTESESLQRQLEFKKLLSQWKRDWESLDSSRYLNHYSATEFKTKELDFKTWASRKRKVNDSKEYIRIGVSNLSIFAYPGDEEMVVMSFDQEYISNNYRSVSTKKQYWKKQSDGDWQIIYES